MRRALEIPEETASASFLTLLAAESFVKSYEEKLLKANNMKMPIVLIVAFFVGRKRIYILEMGDPYLQTRYDRLRLIMFPELCDDLEPNEEMLSGRTSIVQQLIDPTRLLKTAIVELISLQDESELTTKAIPELIKLLGDRDEVVFI